MGWESKDKMIRIGRGGFDRKRSGFFGMVLEGVFVPSPCLPCPFTPTIPLLFCANLRVLHRLSISTIDFTLDTYPVWNRTCTL